MLLFLQECAEPELLPIIHFIRTLLTIIQILIPIGLIIFGTIDLGKAVISSKEDEIKKNQQVLLKRAIAAVLVFLVATIVTFVMGFAGSDTWRDCWMAETNCDYGVDTITGQCKPNPNE